MAKYAKVGTLTADGSTGEQSITGIGFTPSAVLLIWNPTVTTEDAFADDFYVGMGVFADDGGGIQEWSHYLYTDDNASPAQVAGGFTVSTCLSSFGHGQASAVSLDSDGFTIDWTQAAANGQKVYYLAYNSEIFEASAGTMTLPAYSGSVTVSGLPFAPSSLIVAANDGSRFGVGISAQEGDPGSPSGTKQFYAAGGVWNFLGTTYSRGLSSHTFEGAISLRTNNTIFSPVDQSWARDQWNSDGFRITANNTSSPSSSAAAYLALRMTNDSVHRSLAVTADSNTSPVSTSGVWPFCGFFFTPQDISGGGDYGIALGIVDDDLNQRSVWSSNDNVANPSSTAMFSETTEAIKQGNTDGGTNTITLSAAISDWGDQEYSRTRSVSTADDDYYALLHGSTDGSDGVQGPIISMYVRFPQ